VKRRAEALTVYNNKMWLLGGQADSGNWNDVWYSTDGITWTQATSSANWSSKPGLSALTYDNKMWVMDGNSGPSGSNDVWYSINGVTWTRATSSAAWVIRAGAGAVVYNNKMWIIGGYNSTTGLNLKDVWYSYGNGAGEWDWAVQNNNANSATNYYFQMIKSDGTPLDTYSVYPQVTTAGASSGTIVSKVFDVKKSLGAIKSLTWQGLQPAGTGVQFQIAVSNSTSGPWSYMGPACTISPTDLYNPAVNTPILINQACTFGYRYFRYQAILNLNAQKTAGPTINNIIINKGL
jgi:hypothetical protein